jgi:non-ribosomal peptide synthetase component F
MARSHNVADLLELLAGADPDRPALVAGDRRLTYGELNERAGRIGHHLAAAGVEPGEHVAILAHNRVEWIESMLGAYKVRAVPIPVNFRYVADELRHVLYDSDSVALIEVALKAHPDVYDAVVVGLPDERFVSGSPRRWRRHPEPRPPWSGSPSTVVAGWPASRCRVSCGWSTPCSGAQPASPTTPGPGRSSRAPHRHEPDVESQAWAGSRLAGSGLGG